jgi:hypothetical protein
MDDDELERFVDAWLTAKCSSYHEAERFSGAGDKGRDVVGYVTASKLEGEWHNYQCKQLRRRLGETEALIEIGKILSHSAGGEFRLPAKYVFVAPRGVVRTVQELVAQPEKFRSRVRSAWPEVIEKGIGESPVPLSTKIEAAIAEFNFGAVVALDAAKLLKDAHIRSVLVDWFGEDPGRAPYGSTPAEVTEAETPYIGQLLEAYGEDGGTTFVDPTHALSHADYGEHLRDQRMRFFDAAAFERYYRDNTPADYVRVFRDDMYHGVIDTYRTKQATALARVNSVLAQAANVKPSGVLGEYSRVTVRQGYCHHFANDGSLNWSPGDGKAS